MATYKKQLKDQNGDNIIPALGTATVTSTNIDWTNILTDSTAFKLSDYGSNTYLDNRNDGWSGFNLTSGVAFGACTRLNGSWAKDAIGGGMTMTDSLVSGVYYVASEINGGGVGTDGYKPFRFLHNGSALTGDLGFPQRGGSVSSSFFVSLKPGDTLTLQIYCTNDGKTYSMRIWTRGYLVRPTVS